MIDNRLEYAEAARYRWLKSQTWFDQALESYGGMELLDAMDGEGCYIDKSIDYARGVREDK